MALQIFKIASVSVPSTSASIEFTSIPSGYTDLKLVYSVRSSVSSPYDLISYYFNSLTTNRTGVRIEGYGSGVPGYGSGSYHYAYMATGDTALSNTFGNGEIYIPNYTSSNNKASFSFGAAETNAVATIMGYQSNLWSSSAAITTITLIPNTATKVWMQNSSATLYGIK